MRMYDYSEAYLRIEDMFLNGELDEETYKDTMESIGDDAAEKAENLAKMIDNFAADEAKLKEEVAKLQAKRKTLNNSIAFLTNELEVFHKVSGVKQAGLYKLKYRKLPASVDVFDEEALPEAYFRVKKEPNKVDIKKALQDGVDVPGAVLDTDKVKFEVKK